MPVLNQLKKKRGKPSLDGKRESVMIGFKGTIAQKSELENGAKHLGISPSSVMRELVDDFIQQIKKVKT